MFINFFKTALRNIAKHKGFSFINAIGLAVGMTCCLIILLYVTDELTYDSYHEKAGRIYRIALSSRLSGRDFNLATICAPMAETLKSEYPEVEEAVRFRQLGTYTFRYKDNSFRERDIVFSDATLFKVFTIPLLEGNPETALKDPFTVVLSKKTAEKYFGKENPLGRILRVDNNLDFKVTGVFDRIPHNSHFHFEVIVSLETLPESKQPNWIRSNFFTYILLGKGASPRALEAKFPGLVKKYMAPQLEEFMGKPMDEPVAGGNTRISFYLQPLQDIHLHSDLMWELEPNSDITYIHIFSAIALFILIIASINFINLATARSAGRAKEVGIRKVLGSFRGQLIKQFLVESTILSIVSMIIVFFLVIPALPFFNDLSGKEFLIPDFFNWRMALAGVAIPLITGLLAGCYPAFFISAFQPVSVLKGKLKAGIKTGLLRNVLVVFQFTLSIILIVCTLIVMNQLHYIRNRELGFDKEQVLILENANLLGQQAEAFKNEMLKEPRVKYASISAYLPVKSFRNTTTVFPAEQTGAKNKIPIQGWVTDYDYIKTLGMKIVKGRDFSRGFSTDRSAMLINRELVRQLGWNEDEALGKRLSMLTSTRGDYTTYTVIGIVEDFHFESLRNTIGPLVMVIGKSNHLVSFRLDSGNMSGMIERLRDTWNKFLPHQPFEYSFLDERFEAIYRAEQRLGKIFAAFAVLAIFIGCLGLFGLAAFTAEQRTKEIGVRKVLGASLTNIIGMLLKEFALLLAIANIIAWPIAYFIMSKWLQDFAYKASLSVWLFLAAGIAAIIIAVFTVSYQAVRAALANPVDSLKYE